MGSIRLHRQHGVAPALIVCPFCGESTGVALLGAQAENTMKQLGKDYTEYGKNEIPDQAPCSSCVAILEGKGIIFLGLDIGQSLKLTSEQVDSLVGRIVDAKDRCIDIDALRGKVVKLAKAFWYIDDEQNVRLRDPKEWTTE
jgi:hypothetical protein